MRKGVFAALCLLTGLLAIAGCAEKPAYITSGFRDTPDREALHQLHIDAYGKHDPQAILKLAHLFETGTGGEPYSLDKAWDLYMELGVKGNPEAERWLGYICFQYLSDYSCALSWDQKAADQGDAIGKGNLAYLLKYNLGTPEGKQQADEFYRKAHQFTDMQKQNLNYVSDMRKAIGNTKNFSRAALSARAGGIAVVQFEYTGGGKATDVSIYKSSGSNFEDAAAVQAVEAAVLPERPAAMSAIHHYLLDVNFNRPF